MPRIEVDAEELAVVQEFRSKRLKFKYYQLGLNAAADKVQNFAINMGVDKLVDQAALAVLVESIRKIDPKTGR